MGGRLATDYSPSAVGTYHVCGTWRLMSWEDQLAGVDAGLCLRNGPIVDLDLVGCVCEDDARGCAGAPRNTQLLGLRGFGAGANRDGHFGFGVSVVVSLDGDQPTRGQAGARLQLAWGDVDDRQIGQTAIMVDPIVEEPAHILVREPLQRVS